ncbi:MAG: DoxX family protein [Xanthomonadales bacterium]|nr:DoxX family protein [Xanthomonadales bacterium]
MNTVIQKFGPWTELLGRSFLAAIFVLAGYSKIGGYEGTQAYMASMGVPGELLPLVILVELGGGLLIVLGLFTRFSALALAGFSILSGLLFHGSPEEQTQLLKNLAIAGGFLYLFAQGAGRISLDRRLGRS